MNRLIFGCLLISLATAGVGCRCDQRRTSGEGPGPSASTNPTAAIASSSEAATVPPVASATSWPELEWYPWLKASSRVVPEPADTVLRRFSRSLPTGYDNVVAELGTWAEWLRLLPLAASGTPVRDYRGGIVVPGDDEYLAAVVAIDIGTRDLQSSADAVLRLFAEWRWFKEDLRMLYLSDTKLELPLEKWSAGERLVSRAGKPQWLPQAAPQPRLDYAGFREYLQGVLAWSDGPALLAESEPIPPEALEPGAFFIRRGRPARVLVVLDVGTSPGGQRIMLLAQALHPTESIHVIRPNRATAWFPVRSDQPLRVPRAGTFGWDDLRRMKRLRSPPEKSCVGSLCPEVLPPRTRAR
ncbi:MAG: hypothetical protein JW940_03805 [Polyangiaceae bacterium]|nr:hypothetical protein [Polyangiaceae bacterium]